MYAQLLDNSQLKYFNRKFISHNGMTYYNPSEEIMNAEGWYLVSEIPEGKEATSWSLEDGRLVPTLKDIEEEDTTEDETVEESSENDYLKLSKLKIVVQLKQLDLYTKFEEWLKDNDLVEEWNAAQDLKTNNAMFSTALESLREELGLSESEANDIIHGAIMDEED